MLFAGVASKLVPVIVTVVPIGPDVGEKEVIVGCANRLDTQKNKTSTGTYFSGNDWPLLLVRVL